MARWKRRKVFNQANIKFLAVFGMEQKEQLKKFTEIAMELRNFIQFGWTSDISLFKSATGLKNAVHGNVMFLRDFDEPKMVQYTGDLTLASIVSFVREYQMPLLTNMASTEEVNTLHILN